MRQMDPQPYSEDLCCVWFAIGMIVLSVVCRYI